MERKIRRMVEINNRHEETVEMKYVSVIGKGKEREKRIRQFFVFFYKIVFVIVINPQ